MTDNPELLEGPAIPLTDDDIGRMRREEFASYIRDKIDECKRNMNQKGESYGSQKVVLTISPALAMDLIEDLKLAIECSPTRKYAR